MAISQSPEKEDGGEGGEGTYSHDLTLWNLGAISAAKVLTNKKGSLVEDVFFFFFFFLISFFFLLFL